MVNKRQILEAFVLNNPELRELEVLLGTFNLFEAIGAVRQELRHSDFLAFLLNPQESHGLDDVFVKRLLQHALSGTVTVRPDVTPLDIALWELDNLEVRREWRRVDLLLLDESHQLAAIIENKVESGEHSNQLKRYWRTVTQHYPHYHIIGFYLTPDGVSPSDERYIAIDYSLVYEIVDDLARQRASTIGPDVRTVMNHYAQLLRRHIMPDSDIAELCRRIYRRHRQALDLIYEHRPDRQEEIRIILEELVAAHPELIPDHSTKTYTRFIPAAWDTPLLQQGKGWIPSGRMLLCEFENTPDKLRLKVVLGPGPDELRERAFDAIAREKPFRTYRSLAEKWNTIFIREFLNQSDYKVSTIAELEAKINERWQQFLTQDLPRLTEVIHGQDWLWSDHPPQTN